MPTRSVVVSTTPASWPWLADAVTISVTSSAVTT